MAQNVASAFQQDSGTTEFGKLSATFTAHDGVITNKDMKMTSLLINVGGAWHNKPACLAD